ncbi:MAG: hypothetical protein LBI69_00065 [Puniceicoccales bacterium]|jgi:hypothetical protein|nr:hypothetical protein [Puniceicoccales bacterium]
MTGNTPLGTLRLTQAFQMQGEYGKAIKCLKDLSINGAIGSDEIAIFSEMVLWFNFGKEKSPQFANFIFWAIGCMLRWEPNSTSVQMLIKNICYLDYGGIHFKFN